MPFAEEDGSPLRGIDIEQEPAGSLFHLRRAFSYRDPVYQDSVDVEAGLATDLASVPWFLWWLIASYGRHTAAAVVHDKLVVPTMQPAERAHADATFFHALEESGNNWYRHRVMWAAVYAGLTMWKVAPVRFVAFWLHLLGLWIAIGWSIGLLGWLERQPWLRWIPYEGHLPLTHHFAAAAVFAAVLFVIGFAWSFAPSADRVLARKLWPSAVTAVGIIALPTVFIGLGSLVVWAIDWFAACVQAALGRGFERPTPPRPTFRMPSTR